MSKYKLRINEISEMWKLKYHKRAVYNHEHEPSNVYAHLYSI